MAEQTGVLRWQQDHSLGISADDSIAGSSMHLKSITVDFAKWDVDKDKGSIALNYSGDQLYLTVGNGGVTSSSALTLTTSPTSPWDFKTKPGFIMWRGSSLVIDVQGRSSTGIVWLYDFNGSPAQQWAFIQYANALAEMESEKAHSHV
jgi:hypothetical protein